MDGSMVAPAYERGEIVKIAEYNAHDVRATSAVYAAEKPLCLRGALPMSRHKWKVSPAPLQWSRCVNAAESLMFAQSAFLAE